MYKKKEDKFAGIERSKNHRKPRSKTSTDYVNNDRLKEELIKYKEAHDNDKKVPRLTDKYVGDCIKSICNKLSLNHNFVGYSFREEMIEDAIVSCVAAIRNYDPSRPTKPFAYFTECAWWAMVQRIKTEKKENYKKHKNLDYMGDHLRDLLPDVDIHLNVIASFEEGEARSKERKAQKLAEKNKVKVDDN